MTFKGPPSQSYAPKVFPPGIYYYPEPRDKIGVVTFPKLSDINPNHPTHLTKPRNKPHTKAVLFKNIPAGTLPISEINSVTGSV